MIIHNGSSKDYKLELQTRVMTIFLTPIEPIPVNLFISSELRVAAFENSYRKTICFFVNKIKRNEIRM